MSWTKRNASAGRSATNQMRRDAHRIRGGDDFAARPSGDAWLPQSCVGRRGCTGAIAVYVADHIRIRF